MAQPVLVIRHSDHVPMGLLEQALTATGLYGGVPADTAPLSVLPVALSSVFEFVASALLCGFVPRAVFLTTVAVLEEVYAALLFSQTLR